MDVEIYGQLTLRSRTGLVVLANHLTKAAAGGGLHGCTPVKVSYAGHAGMLTSRAYAEAFTGAMQRSQHLTRIRDVQKIICRAYADIRVA